MTIQINISAVALTAATICLLGNGAQAITINIDTLSSSSESGEPGFRYIVNGSLSNGQYPHPASAVGAFVNGEVPYIRGFVVGDAVLEMQYTYETQAIVTPAFLLATGLTETPDVPLIAEYVLQASVLDPDEYSSDYASASIRVDAEFPPDSFAEDENGFVEAGPLGDNFNFPNVKTQQRTGSLEFYNEAQTTLQIILYGTAIAYADPVAYVDPNWEYSQYSDLITISYGQIANQSNEESDTVQLSAVPLPASFLPMIFSFFAFFGLRFRVRVTKQVP